MIVHLRAWFSRPFFYYNVLITFWNIEYYLVKEIPFYNFRYTIRPGLSGWAQVNYNYGASIEDSKNKFSYEVFYLKNFSLFLDLLIFLKTIKLVIRMEGSTPKSDDSW